MSLDSKDSLINELLRPAAGGSLAVEISLQEHAGLADRLAALLPSDQR